MAINDIMRSSSTQQSPHHQQPNDQDFGHRDAAIHTLQTRSICSPHPLPPPSIRTGSVASVGFPTHGVSCCHRRPSSHRRKEFDSTAAAAAAAACLSTHRPTDRPIDRSNQASRQQQQQLRGGRRERRDWAAGLRALKVRARNRIESNRSMRTHTRTCVCVRTRGGVRFELPTQHGRVNH